MNHFKCRRHFKPYHNIAVRKRLYKYSFMAKCPPLPQRWLKNQSVKKTWSFNTTLITTFLGHFLNPIDGKTLNKNSTLSAVSSSLQLHKFCRTYNWNHLYYVFPCISNYLFKIIFIYNYFLFHQVIRCKHTCR